MSIGRAYLGRGIGKSSITRAASRPNGPYAPTFGPELLLNPNFDDATAWVDAPNWTISAGAANHAAGATSSFVQTVTLTPGAAYRIEINITALSGGILRVQFSGGTSVLGTSRNTPGIYTQDLVAVTGNISFDILASSPAVASVTSVSLRQVL